MEEKILILLSGSIRLMWLYLFMGSNFRKRHRNSTNPGLHQVFQKESIWKLARCNGCNNFLANVSWYSNMVPHLNQMFLLLIIYRGLFLFVPQNDLHTGHMTADTLQTCNLVSQVHYFWYCLAINTWNENSVVELQ